jgi:hypothetical protein
VANIRIAVINVSTVLTDEVIKAALPDLATQIHRDFAPAWGIDADLVFVEPNERIPDGAWWLVILDTSDQANALGYHDVTADGLPLGKVFAQSDIELKSSWTVTASHEILEMLGDPDINLTVFVQKEGGGCRLYAYEVCDACEADEDGYLIESTLVSDFVYPAWFETFRKPGTRFDHRNLIQAPLQLRVGGYIAYNDIIDGLGWQQFFAEGRESDAAKRPRVGSRRERRKTNRDSWDLSTTTTRRRAGA